MSKAMTPEERAQYQREYRARRKAVEPMDPVLAEIVKEDPTLLNIARRDSLDNPYTDGMPDTPYLIQNMSQWNRDQLLGKLPMTKRSSQS